MCSSESRPNPKPEELEQYYRTDPVPQEMPVTVESLDVDRLEDQCERHDTNPHVAYWWLWLLHLGRQEGTWVGVSWAMIDREVFVACPGMGRFEWLLWQLVRLVTFIFTLGRIRLAPMEIDELSRLGMRRAFWMLVHLQMLERREKAFDGLTLEVFYPTPRLAERLAIIAHDPSQN